MIRIPSVPIPGYGNLRMGLPLPRLAAVLKAARPDLVHLANPFVLGARGMSVATAQNLPTIAVYQTDLPSYARMYYRFELGERAAWRWIRRVHNMADRTLAPSTSAATALVGHGVERVWLWRRGVDAAQFDPGRRSANLHKALAPNGELLVGYVGRLAHEKRVDLLAPLSRMPGVRVVIVGDGPARPGLERALPGAIFLAERRGGQLARIYASLDVFVHTGPYETFGQTVQEALASGLPVVAPAAGGPLDLVDHDRTGFLVPPFDGEAIASAVAALAADPDKRRRMGFAARAAVERRTWPAVCDELIQHYVSVHSAGIAAWPVEVPA